MKNFNFDEGILEKVLSDCCEPYNISIVSKDTGRGY